MVLKDRIGRIGLVGRGVLYGIVALLAVELALGWRDGEPSPQGAIAWIAQRPTGKVLLVALTVALFALAMWRFLDSAMGDPVEGGEASDRVRFAAKGCFYSVLAVVALRATWSNWSGGQGGRSASGGSQAQKEATAVVLSWPLGPWIVGAAGLGLIGYAVFMLKHHAIDEKFRERLAAHSDGVRAVGRVGYGARSVVWAISGVLVVEAALTYDPNKAGGISAALEKLAQMKGGALVLGLVAAGLLAFAAFCVAEAKYRRAA